MSGEPRFHLFSRHPANFGPFCRFWGLTGLFPMSSQGLTGDGHAIFRSLPTRKMGLNLGAPEVTRGIPKCEGMCGASRFSFTPFPSQSELLVEHFMYVYNT